MTRVPRILWTYWHTQDLPPFVEQCIESWKRALPEFPTLHILHSKHELVEGLLRKAPKSMPPAKSSHFSDWLRLTVVERWGGMWLDASILVNNGKQLRDIVSVVEEKNLEVGGYDIKPFQTLPNFPILESWLFCAPQGSRFMTDWKREFDRALTLGFDEYRKVIQTEGVDPQNIYKTSGTYLTIHVAAQAAMQRRVGAAEYMITANAVELGPYQMHKDAYWSDTVLGLFMLTRQYDKYPIVKVRGSERSAHLRFILYFSIAILLCFAMVWFGM